MAWQALALMCVVFALLLVVPGAVMLRLLGARALTALGAGPAVSSALYAVAAAGLAALDVPWRPAPVLGLLTVPVLVAGGVASLRARRERRLPERPSGDDRGLGGVARRARALLARALSTHPTSWLLPVALLLASVLAVVPVAVGMGEPDAPLQQWDGVFHLNGVALIRETGDAVSLDGLYGAGAHVYYPTVWHSLVALLPATGVAGVFDVSAAANASTLVMASVGWFLGLAALAREVFPGRRHAPALVVAVGGAFSMFPTVQLSTLAQWPNALSVMLLPGTCALVVAAVGASRAARASRASRTPHAARAARDGGAHRSARSRAITQWTGVVLAVLGVATAHGTGVFGLAVLVGPYLVTVLWTAARDAYRVGRRRLVAVWVAVVLLLLAAGTAVVLTSPVVAVLLNFERLPQRDYWESLPRTLLDLVLTGRPGNVVVSLAVVVGSVVLLRARTHRWLVVSAVAVCALTALAAGPQVPLRAITGLWYAQGARIEALYPIPAALLAVVGISWLAERVTQGRRAGSVVAGAIVVLALVSSGGFQAAERAGRYAEAYDPARIRWGTMLSEEEIDLMRRLPAALPDDARVLGDPSDGAALAYALAGVDVVLPQLGTSRADEHQAYLRASFRDIGHDPLVCEHLAAVGATHLYLDPTGAEGGAKVDTEAPGLQDVDTSTGFTLVASAGPAQLFEITACG